MFLPEERLPADSQLGPIEVRAEAAETSEPARGLQATQEQLGIETFPGTSVWAIHPLALRVDEAAGPGARLLQILLATMRRGRRCLAGGALVGVGFGAAYLLFAAPIFIVKTLLLVEQRRSVFRGDDARAGGAPVATHAEIYQSPALIAQAIRRIGIPEPEETGVLASVRGWLPSLGGVASAEAGIDPLAAAVLEMLPSLQASPVVGTDVMAVTLRTDDPERGVRLLEALTASFRNYLRDNETAAQREGLAVLRDRATALAAQIAAATARYEALAARLGVLGDGEVGVAAQRISLEEHARARAEAQRSRIDLENELAALRESPDARIAPSVAIQDELVRAEASLAELRSRHTARHPAVQQAEQQAAGLREQVRVATRSRSEELERELRAARRSEAALAELQAGEWKKVATLEAGRSEAGAVAAEVARLEEQRTAVLALLPEKELSVLAAEVGANSGMLVRVLEAPSLPPSPVWPLAVPVLLACGVVGSVGGLGAALLAEGRQRTPGSRLP